jgi:hypothetical protein
MSTTKTTEQSQQELETFHETHFDKLGNAIDAVLSAMEDCPGSCPRRIQVWVRLNAAAQMLNNARALASSARWDDKDKFERQLDTFDGRKSIVSQVKIVG